MKQTFTKFKKLKGHFFNEGKFLKTAIASSLLLFGLSKMDAQSTTLIPFSGSNTVTCGTNTRLLDHAGTGTYANNANGFTVIDAGFQGVINITGSYQTESCCDPIRIYSGAGIAGPLLATYLGTGNMNFSGTPGQTLTVRFQTDGSVVYSGLDFTVTSTGACFAAPCSGTPGSNSVIVTPTVPVCAGASAFLGLNSYTVGGLTYQWQQSTVSNVGPYTPIPNATLSAYVTPTLNTPVYYSAVITCTNSASSFTTASAQVLIQGTTISQVPYLENFEGIYNTNQLPNCSWSASSPNGLTRTYTTTLSEQRSARSGSKFASFYYFPSGTNHFYTNGIQLNAGVTYSTSLWYKTNYYGDLNWSNISILLGTSQSTTGLVTLASSNGPAASTSYMSLASTFTVASSGIYYVAVRGVSAGGCCAYHLNWDDLEIIAPCSINSPSLSVNASTTTICSGEAVTLNASGAITYSWSHGPTTAQVIESPLQSTMYSVVGTNTASGCAVTVNQFIQVNPAPSISIFADKQVVCSGQPAVLTAFGANTYTWSNSSNSNFITVAPTVNTTYSVIGSNAAGCTSGMAQQVTVLTNPVVTGSSDRGEICKGESATLTGGGAVTYQWASASLFVQSSAANVSPNVNTTYTLTGLDNNGCKGITTVAVNVQECVGLKEMTSTLSGVKVYPNPNGGEFTILLSNGANKTVEILDMTGRVISTSTGKAEVLNMDITGLVNGIYYVKIQSNDGIEVIKVIKN